MHITLVTTPYVLVTVVLFLGGVGAVAYDEDSSLSLPLVGAIAVFAAVWPVSALWYLYGRAVAKP